MEHQADTALTNGSTYRDVELSKVRISPDNRKRFNEAALQELAASIKSMGVAQPILVRPVIPTVEQPEEYEIVAGERRYRASNIAGMGTIPAIVRQLSDLDAAKIRILENLQREDPHPVEEAEGYQLLMLQHGYNADQLAEEVKKSRAYIYARLKLCALTPEVREQFLDDKIPASTALLIARIPVPALQVKALGEILNPQYGSEPLSYRRAVEHIQSRYMLNLSTAIFKLNDSKVLASAGSCVKCPKRTGNQPELYSGLSADVCTDPDCFAEKKAAHQTATIALANKKGIPVHEAQEGAALRQKAYSSESELVHADNYIMYFARNAPHTKNAGLVSAYLKLEALQALEVAAYLKGSNGDLTPMYRRETIQAALEAAGVCETVEQHQARMREIEADPSKAPPKSAHELKREQEVQERRAAEAAAEKENSYRLALYKKLRQQASVNGLSLPSLRAYVKVVLDENYLAHAAQSLYEVDLKTDSTTFIDTANAGTLQLLLLDIMLGNLLEVGWYDIKSGGAEDDGFSAIVSMARHEGIDVDAVRAEAYPVAEAVDQAAEPKPTEAAYFNSPSSFCFDGIATYADMCALIERNPEKLNEITPIVLAHPRGELVGMLEFAAQQQGYTWAGQEWVQANAPAPVNKVEEPAEPIADESPSASAETQAQLLTDMPPAGVDEVDEITPEATTASDAAAAKTSTPAKTKAVATSSKKVASSKTKAAQETTKAADADPGPWPFPKSANMASKPAKGKSKRVAAEEATA